MANIQIQELTTPRLQLRRLTEDDAPIFYEKLGSSKAVTQYMLWQPHMSIEDSIASIQKALRGYEDGSSCRWAIVRKDRDSLIGMIALLPRDVSQGVYSFAYMLAEDVWNQGYGTEALKAVIAFAFQECSAQCIVADHFAENPASGIVMKKAGMQYHETIPGKYEKNGVRHDAIEYTFSRSQWQESTKIPI